MNFTVSNSVDSHIDHVSGDLNISTDSFGETVAVSASTTVSQVSQSVPTSTAAG